MPRKPSGPLTITLFGVTIPIPRWSLHAFGVVAVGGAAFMVYQQAYPAEATIVTLQQANAALRASQDEYEVHWAEMPIATTEAMTVDGSVALNIYADGCVSIRRQTARATLSKLVVDIARGTAPRTAWALLPTVHAAAQRSRCDGHPGPFSWAYGARFGDWVEVWRTWPDGCQHVQMMHVSGAFETYPDGSPKVRWTRCQH